MTWTRLAACAGLLGVLALAPSAARAVDLSTVQQLQFERSLTEMLAKARVERVMGEVEVEFLEERLASDDWEALVFEFEDALVAELVDAWMEVRIEELGLQGRYGEQHPERVALAARLGVLEDAVRREAGSVVEVQRMRLDLSRSKEDKFTSTLTESGGRVDEGAMEPAFAAMVAQLRALELEARVEAEHHERLLADGHGEQAARSIGKGGLTVLLLAHMERQVEDAQLALKYGEQHPSRVELRAEIEEMDRLLVARAEQAVAASRLRAELLQRQIEAMEELRGRGGGGGATP